MSIKYFTTYRKFDLPKEKQLKKEKIIPSPLILSKPRIKRKYDDIINNSENEEQNIMHPLQNTEIYRTLLLLSKKEKFDKIMFSAKIVSGILIPTLPQGFRPIPDYEYESEYNYDADYEDDCEQCNLIMLANVITNLEKL